VRKTYLAVALALYCVAVLAVTGCEDMSTAPSAADLGSATEMGPTTTSEIDSTTTTEAGDESTTAAAPTTTTAVQASTTTSAAAQSGPAPKEYLLKGTYQWDVDIDGAADLWYQIVDELVHYLVPENGAGLARIDGKTFAVVGLGDLQAAAYASAGLATEGVDDPNVLMVGSVIALRTSAGQYAKLEVAGFEPGTLTGGITAPRFNIGLRYVLYPK
jgi:hypothetical protein